MFTTKTCQKSQWLHQENRCKQESSSDPEVGERCLVNILDKYILKLPPHALEHDMFYLRPLQVVPADPKAPWYAAVPVGRDTLQKKFHLTCEQAGIKGNKTNHHLRATGVT